jgi:hypothetical protein
VAKDFEKNLKNRGSSLMGNFLMGLLPWHSSDSTPDWTQMRFSYLWRMRNAGCSTALHSNLQCCQNQMKQWFKSK